MRVAPSNEGGILTGLPYVDSARLGSRLRASFLPCHHNGTVGSMGSRGRRILQAWLHILQRQRIAILVARQKWRRRRTRTSVAISLAIRCRHTLKMRRVNACTGKAIRRHRRRLAKGCICNLVEVRGERLVRGAAVVEDAGGVGGRRRCMLRHR